MTANELEKKLEVLWEEFHTNPSENPPASFIEYFKLALEGYKTQLLSSEEAAYNLCGAFLPDLIFEETKETEELMDLVCDLELGENSVYRGKEKECWDKVEELLQTYENSLK